MGVCKKNSGFRFLSKFQAVLENILEYKSEAEVYVFKQLLKVQ
jgi:hypothetical protein